MLSEDRDAVICDLAETYHILDYKAVPVQTLATLCAGLRDDSRIKMHLSGFNYVPDVFTNTHISDELTLIRYFLTGNRKEPKLYQDIMNGKRKQNNTVGYSSPEEFEKARKRLIHG